jgi:MFS family permease
MRTIPGLILRDPSLRMVAGGLLLFAAFASSLGVHQSLLAVEVFGLSDTGYALVLLLAMSVAVTGSIVMGIATDRGPRRRQMALLAAVATLAGAALVALTRAPLAFLLAHVILIPLGGTIFGQLFAAGRLASAPYPPATRDGLLAILRALFAVPFMLGLPLWGIAFSHGLPLLALYPVVAAVAALHLLLVWRAWPHDAHAPWQETKSGLDFRASLREMSAGPVILRVALIGAIQSGSAIVGIILGLLFAAVGRGTGDVGLFFGLFVVLEVVGTLSAGLLVRRLPRLLLIATGVALYAFFLALLPFLADTAWLWALILPAGLGGGLIYPLAIAYLQDLLAERPGAGGSLIAVQRVAAEGLTTAIFGLGAWAQGYATVALLGAGAVLLAMGAILRLDGRQPKKPGPAS